MGTFFLAEAQPHGAIGFRCIAPGPRRILLVVACVLTGLLVVSILVKGPDNNRALFLFSLAFLWLWVYAVVPAWNRFVVRSLFRFTAPQRIRDREAFYRFFEAGFTFGLLWILVGQLLLVWGILT